MLGVIGYTLVKFVLFKPTKLPQPEKEQVRLSPIHTNFLTEIEDTIEEVPSSEECNTSSMDDTDLIVDCENDKITLSNPSQRFKDKDI